MTGVALSTSVIRAVEHGKSGQIKRQLPCTVFDSSLKKRKKKMTDNINSSDNKNWAFHGVKEV